MATALRGSDFREPIRTALTPADLPGISCLARPVVSLRIAVDRIVPVDLIG